MEQIITVLFIIIILNLFITAHHQKLIGWFNIYDKPDKKRKFHKNKTSLIGGTIILVNVIIFILLDYIFNSQKSYQIIFPYLILGSISFYIFGLIDDKKDLNSNLKFVIEALIIFFLVLIDDNLLIEKIYFYSLGVDIELGSFSYLFTILSITIFINALNMFDGINLQAGSYCLIIICSLILYSQMNFFLMCLIISLITFLYLNYKSKLFLGDNGTYLLGFLISYLIIYTAKNDNYFLLSADKIFIMMLLPGLDLIRLFIVRLSKKKHPFSPDRKHIHHILIKKIGYQKTILFLISFTALSNIMMYYFTNYIVFIIILFVLIYIVSLKIYE